MSGHYDTDPLKEVAKLALNGTDALMSSMLKGIVEYCFIQLEYRQSPHELAEFVKELGEPYELDLPALSQALGEPQP